MEGEEKGVKEMASHDFNEQIEHIEVYGWIVCEVAASCYHQTMFNVVFFFVFSFTLFF